MKTQFLPLCLFLLFTCTISAEEDAVLDDQGNKLQVGSKYYAVSAIWGAGGGGLSLSNYRNQECATTVTQEPRDRNYGIPCTFHPAEASPDGTIRVSKSLNVKFDPDSNSVPSCAKSTVWQVGGLDPYTRSHLITIGAVEGNPGCATRNNWFKIEKGFSNNVYMFTYNPNDVCSADSGESYDLGVAFAFGKRPLVQMLPGNGFNVVFRKYEDVQVIRNKAAAYTAQ